MISVCHSNPRASLLHVQFYCAPCWTHGIIIYEPAAPSAVLSMHVFCFCFQFFFLQFLYYAMYWDIWSWTTDNYLSIVMSSYTKTVLGKTFVN